ncbi:MAG TPA: UDP-2,3-diacylglucosamine diphosphatase LpxI [Phycisphaerae bacterium]|nr:UDP-2,3-diacylglucosamine diphosphatase LpxI [Phycisphaerae bacterium]
MSSSENTLGLIAGEGEFPKLVARGARSAGLRVVAVGLRGTHDPEIRGMVDAYYQAGIARLGRWIRIFRRQGASRVIMAGRVRKARILELPLWRQALVYWPDWVSIKLWFFSSRDRRNDTLLSAVAEEMARRGVTLIDSTTYSAEAMAPEGLLTRRDLSPAQRSDADLGWRIAREMGRLDVGQAVVAFQGDIVAVEAIEGTDRMIERAGDLCKKPGWVLVKVAKPNQDMRFDVPTIGPNTIEKMSKHGGAALVVEAGKTLVLEKDETLRLANVHGISIVGRRGDHTSPELK